MIETEPSKYDLVVLLALNPIRVYESIILSGRLRHLRGQNTRMVAWKPSGQAELACPLCLGRPLAHVERSLGGLLFDHIMTAQLIMSDLQTFMGDESLTTSSR